MRTIRFYSHMAFTILRAGTMIPALKKKKEVMQPNEFAEYVYTKIQGFAMSHLKISGATVEIIGEENIPRDRAVLFIANHQGLFDIAMFLGPIPTAKGCVAKFELKKFPILSTWMEYINCVFLDRKDVRKAAKAILSGVEILKSGYSLAIFPEGTRSGNANTAEFKAGSFKLATKAKVPIIPVTMDGTYKLMERQGRRIRPDSVRVIIHPMIETAELSREEEVALPGRVRDIICSALTEA